MAGHNVANDDLPAAVGRSESAVRKDIREVIRKSRQRSLAAAVLDALLRAW